MIKIVFFNNKINLETPEKIDYIKFLVSIIVRSSYIYNDSNQLNKRLMLIILKCNGKNDLNFSVILDKCSLD